MLFLFKNLELTVELFRRDLVRYLFSQTRRSILHRKKQEFKDLSIVFAFPVLRGGWIMHRDTRLWFPESTVPLYPHCHTNVPAPRHFGTDPDPWIDAYTGLRIRSDPAPNPVLLVCDFQDADKK
jgi:hypothetical protein